MSAQKPFNKTTLAKFITVYSDKLTSTLQEPCSFTPAALLELIREKLATLVAVDDQTKGQSVIIDRKVRRGMHTYPNMGDTPLSKMGDTHLSKNVGWGGTPIHKLSQV